MLSDPATHYGRAISLVSAKKFDEAQAEATLGVLAALLEMPFCERHKKRGFCLDCHRQELSNLFDRHGIGTR